MQICYLSLCRSSKPNDAIYSILREMADPDTVRFDDARQCILAKGYTPDQFDECLDEYECGRSTNHEPGSLSYSTWIGRHCERYKASCYTNFFKRNIFETTLSIKIISYT